MWTKLCCVISLLTKQFSLKKLFAVFVSRKNQIICLQQPNTWLRSPNGFFSVVRVSTCTKAGLGRLRFVGVIPERLIFRTLVIVIKLTMLKASLHFALILLWHCIIITTLTSSLLLNPRQEDDNVVVDSRVVGCCTQVSHAKADNAVLKPAVTLLTDQRTTRVAAARVSIALHRSGAYHVLRQNMRVFSIKITTCVPVDDRYCNLSQPAVVSGPYMHEHHTVLSINSTFTAKCCQKNAV